jgi:hypothetical protein
MTTISTCSSNSVIFHLHYTIPVLRIRSYIVDLGIYYPKYARLGSTAYKSMHSIPCPALAVFYLVLRMLNTYQWQTRPNTRHNSLQVTPQNTGVSYTTRPFGLPSSQPAIKTADHQDTTLQCLSLMHDWLTRFITTVTVLKLRHRRYIRVVQTWVAYGLVSGTPCQ